MLLRCSARTCAHNHTRSQRVVCVFGTPHRLCARARSWPPGNCGEGRLKEAALSLAGQLLKGHSNRQATTTASSVVTRSIGRSLRIDATVATRDARANLAFFGANPIGSFSEYPSRTR